MRKTLTVLAILAASASLAACKMFWEHDKTPDPTPAAAGSTGGTTSAATATPVSGAPTPEPAAQAAPVQAGQK